MKLGKLEKVIFGLAGLALVGSQYQSFDFSKVRSQQHQRTPITKNVENKKGEKYAVLVSARGDDRFKKYITFGYQSLLRAGFLPKNVYVLTGNENIGEYVKGEATKENLMQVLQELMNKVTNKDILLFYITNHGNKDFFWESTVSLDGGDISSFDLWKVYQKIKPNFSVEIFAQCFGNGFAERFGYNNHIGISASAPDKVAISRSWEENDGFSIQWFEALGGRKPNGETINPDKNNDGRISIKEVFDYAVKNNPYTRPRLIPFMNKQTPQIYWQNANPKNLFIR